MGNGSTQPRSATKSKQHHTAQMHGTTRGTSQGSCILSPLLIEKNCSVARHLLWVPHISLSKEKACLINCLPRMKQYWSWKIDRFFFFLSPVEAFKMKYFNLVAMFRKLQFWNLWPTAALLLQVSSWVTSMDQLLLLDTCCLSYAFYFSFLWWATFHFSFMQPMFIFKKKIIIPKCFLYDLVSHF